MLELDEGSSYHLSVGVEPHTGLVAVVAEMGLGEGDDLKWLATSGTGHRSAVSRRRAMERRTRSRSASLRRRENA